MHSRSAAKHPTRWDIPQSLWGKLNEATELLALAALSERVFFTPFFAPHLNATMFRAALMPVAAGDAEFAVNYPRIGNYLRVAGRKHSNTVFQQPAQIESTACEVVNDRLLRGLAGAKRARHEVWNRISDAREFFLLANSESGDLAWESCVMLSAMAFERLLAPRTPGAAGLAESFAGVWSGFPHLPLGKTKMKPDPNPKWAAEQVRWPVHRKWVKELYEARSASAHLGSNPGRSSNWVPWKHLVIAAFTFPLLVKVLLSNAGFYQLSDNEEVAGHVLDNLLVSNWGNARRYRPPEWPSILSEAQAERAIRKSLEKAYAKVVGA